MAQLNVNVDNPTTTPVNVAIASPTSFATYSTLAPTISGIYLFSANDLPGVAAANNFLTLSNPVGSGKTIYVVYINVGSYAYSGGAAVSSSLIVSSATAVSGGTLETANIVKYSPAYPAASMVVRSGNPTATAGPAWVAVPPPFNSGSGVSTIVNASLESNSATGTPALSAGDSLLLRTASGDVDQRWNITVAWVEF